MKASIIFVGVAAAVLAGCGGIGGLTGASAGAAKASPSPSRGFGGNVVGQVTKLASGKMTVNEQSGDVTVAYDTSTMVLQSGAGTMADAVAGACVTATGERDASGAVTATALQVELNMNGNCNQPAGGFAGASPNPSFSPRVGRGGPSPGASPGGPPANLGLVRGKVASVSGTTLTVQPETGAPVTVVVPSMARIMRIVTSSTARLAVGECVTATGQRDSSGTIKARNIVISAPGPNGCTRAGGAGGGGGGGGRPTRSPSPGFQ